MGSDGKEMKLPSWFRVIWWFVLVGFFIFLFVQRYDSIINGTATATDIAIFLIFTALIAIPLFQEVSLFGVSFKKEIEYPSPSPDNKLPEIRKIAEATLKEELGELTVEPLPTPEATIPNDVSYLFAVRYNIENELTRLTDLYWISEDKKFYPKTVTQKLEFLVKMKAIHRNLAYILKEMYAWSSAAIHGEQISEHATQWIRQDAAGTIQALKGIPDMNIAAATKVQRDD